MTATSRHSLPPAAAATAGLDDADAVAVLAAAVKRAELREVEVMWVDHQGHARGKRIGADSFLERARGAGFAFCNAALVWDVAGDVKPGLRHAGWGSGFPDMFAVPDLGSFRRLPWRDGAGHVISDLVDHHGELVAASPRTVLRRAVDRLAALGYQARIGVEIEFHLLGPDNSPLGDGVQAYSLQVLNQLEPAFGSILDGLRGFVELEGGNSEYGPGQCEINLAHLDALQAADQAARFKYATRELARRAGALATFMAKPFADQAGNSMHLHLSLWRDGEPAFAPDGETENSVMRGALGGILEHLPGIVLYGAPTVNSYKRFEVGSFAPPSATWGGDNRTVAIRSLIETPAATRVELRVGAADAQPHCAIASLLAATIAGLESDADPGERGEGDLYVAGSRLPRHACRRDRRGAVRHDGRRDHRRRPSARLHRSRAGRVGDVRQLGHRLGPRTLPVERLMAIAADRAHKRRAQQSRARPTSDPTALRRAERFPALQAIFSRRSRRFALGAELTGPLAYRSAQRPASARDRRIGAARCGGDGITGVACDESPFLGGDGARTGADNSRATAAGRIGASSRSTAPSCYGPTTTARSCYPVAGRVDRRSDPGPIRAAVAATKLLAAYIWERYGRLPATIDPFLMTVWYQAHHLDIDFCDRFYPRAAAARHIRKHIRDWHPDART